jgi:DNA-binding NarL/FixJ family response regulator
MSLSMPAIRVAVLDDHEIVRMGLISILENEPAIAVVGSHRSSQELFAALDVEAVDLVLLDYSLSVEDIDGLELLSSLRRQHPTLRLLMVSAHENPIACRMALQAGANGYFVKSQPLSGLPKAIEAVIAGITYVQGDAVVPADIGQPPTASEWSMLRGYLAGLSLAEIAIQQNRSIKAIRQQKLDVFAKLGIRDDADLRQLQTQIDALR